MPTDSDAPDTTDFISLGSRLSRWKLTPFAAGLFLRDLLGDFLGDFINLYDLVGLLVSLYGFAYPRCWPWIVGLFGTIVLAPRLGVF